MASSKFPYNCEFCSNGFSRKEHLDTHQRNVHEGIKPFECQECGKCLGWKITLKKHQIKIHNVHEK